jgi:uncharacterized membrane protein YhaH (DUF805 family)
VSGRLGRLRYFAYSFWLTFVGMFLVTYVLDLPLPYISDAISALLGYGSLIAALLVLSTRRLEDMGRSGWWAVLVLIPVLNVIFGMWLLLARGSATSNRYGPAPPGNSWFLVVGGCIVPILLVATLLVAGTYAYKKFYARALAQESKRSQTHK